jgi:hypothetical protein
MTLLEGLDKGSKTSPRAIRFHFERLKADESAEVCGALRALRAIVAAPRFKYRWYN